MFISGAVAILSLYALYAAAINVFLSTSLFEKVIDQDPETLFVSYARGWSIWPGRIHARHLIIRSSDSHVQWVLRIERCEFDVSFFDLAARRKFHLTRVAGSGVTFEARQRVASPAATPEYVAALPPIPGFPELPLTPNELPDLRERWDDRYWHLWTVELENVIADDVREVWVDTLRFEGSARIRGGFFLKPLRDVHVGPLHVDVRRGRVTAKERSVAEPVAGAVDLRLLPFDPRTIESVALLQRMSMVAELRGRCPDLADLPRNVTGPLEMAGPADVRRLAVRIEDGKVVKGSHLDVGMPDGSVEVARHRITGELVLVADVPEDAGPARLTFGLDAHAITAKRMVPDDEALLFQVPVARVSGDASALDLAAPLRDLHVIAVLPAGTVPDLRSLARYIPSDGSFAVMGGRGRAHGRIEAWLDGGRAKGEAGLDADDLDLRVAKTRIAGGAKVDASFESWRWRAKRLDGLRAKVHVVQGSIATQAAPTKALVDVKGFEIGIDAPEVDLDDPMRNFEAKVDMPDGEIVDRGLLRSYLPRGNDMRVAAGHARFEARCAIDVRDHRGRGTFDVRASHLGFTLDELDLFANLRAHARVHDWSWEKGDLALDGVTVELTRLSSTRRGANEAAATIASLVVAASSDRFDLQRPFQHIEIGGRLRGGRLVDPTALDAFLSKSSKVRFDAREGGARFEVDVGARIDGRVARGRISVRGHGIGVHGTKVRVLGELDAFADVARWPIDTSVLQVSRSRIVADDVVVRLGEAAEPDLRTQHVELSAKIDELDFDRPSLRGVDFRLIVDDARMDDATRLNALLAKPGAAPALVVESGKARASADVTVLASQRTASGDVRVAIDRAGLRFHETHLEGDVALVGRVRAFDGARDIIDLAGSTVTLRNVRATGAKAETTAWNGDVTLVQGDLRASEAPALDAFVQLRADDANPILAMALRNTLPKFLVGLVRAPGLSGQARVALEPGRSALVDVRVRGGNVVAFGDYVVAGDHERGAFVIAKGGVSAGVKVDDRGTYVRLFALERWHEEERAAAMALFASAVVSP